MQQDTKDQCKIVKHSWITIHSSPVTFTFVDVPFLYSQTILQGIPLVLGKVDRFCVQGTGQTSLLHEFAWIGHSNW